MVQIDRQLLTDACNNVDDDVRRKRQVSDAVYLPAEVLQPALQENADVMEEVIIFINCAHLFRKYLFRPFHKISNDKAVVY